jgi:hypothetical protein
MFRAISCCAFLLLCSVAQGGIINADFETGDLTGWTLDTLGSPGTAGVEPDGADGYRAVVRLSTAPSGAINMSSVSQIFTVTTRSDISFDAIGTLDTDSGAIFAAVSVSTATPGSGVVRISPTPEAALWQQLGQLSIDDTYTYRVDAGTYKIDFTMFSSAIIGGAQGTYANIEMFLDNVAIVEVPEPSTIALLLLGAITHLGIRRSRSACRR